MLPVGSLGYSPTIRKRIAFVHRDTGFAAHQHSRKAPPDIPNPSDSSIALLMKDDSFRPENPCQEQVLLASVVLCATERAAQNLNQVQRWFEIKLIPQMDIYVNDGCLRQNNTSLLS